MNKQEGVPNREKLVLITNRTAIAAMYLGELEKVFGSLLALSSYALDQDAQASELAFMVSKADIVLLTGAEQFEGIRAVVSDSCRVIILQYGFLKEKIEYLKAFPKNTSALVCFNFHFVSAQIVAMLYENGMKNMDLEAYKIGDPISDKHYDIAIVGDNSATVPQGIERVVSLGMRKLSLSTLLSIASAADILTEELEDTFQEYCRDIYTENKTFARFYDIFSVNKIQLKTIMNCIDYAVLICDGEYRIVDFNDKVKSMFDINRNINRLYIGNIPEFSTITQQILSPKPVKDLLVETEQRKSLLLSREDISSAWEVGDYHIILIQDVTKILTLEQSFKKQLSQKGHITKYNFSSILGKSEAIETCVKRAKKIAALDKPTLIIGESGTGKELFAQSIHSFSPRSAFPFLAINCATLPTALLESELFGYTEGAFTGAKKGGHIGLFEMANKGTFFLDEIGEISLETQAKLLRVLEEHEIMRVGSSEIVPIDVRVIAATNKNLRELVQSGKFRMDLYYRLNTLELNIPPVRARKEDIPLLVQHTLDSDNLSHISVSKEAMDFFINFSWEGNVREIRNCVEYMAHVSDGIITLEHLPNYIIEEYKERQSASMGTWGETLSDENQTLSREILQLLAQREMGRTALLRALQESHRDISDYHLRQLIERLHRENLLQINKGRKGMKPTKLGFEILGE